MSGPGAATHRGGGHRAWGAPAPEGRRMAEVKVMSELNALIWKVVAAAGDRVEDGQTLIILECMKTEIPVPAPCAGRVLAIAVEEGQVISERQVLVVLET
jgi:acetyl-CoA carboxylase biotin carboxyl carrier protein